MPIVAYFLKKVNRHWRLTLKYLKRAGTVCPPPGGVQRRNGVWVARGLVRRELVAVSLRDVVEEGDLDGAGLVPADHFLELRVRPVRQR